MIILKWSYHLWCATGCTWRTHWRISSSRSQWSSFFFFVVFIWSLVNRFKLWIAATTTSIFHAGLRKRFSKWCPSVISYTDAGKLMLTTLCWWHFRDVGDVRWQNRLNSSPTYSECKCGQVRPHVKYVCRNKYLAIKCVAVISDWSYNGGNILKTNLNFGSTINGTI